jgi:predicted nuclease of predicted toxin-antitoxin system
MRFLIDECLTIDLIRIAAEAGYEAQHVARIGRAGWKDWNVASYAADGDFVLVTNNASDFRKLYAANPLHTGLIIIVPNVDRGLQQTLFRAALDTVASANDLVNRVLEVGIDGENVTLDLYDLPSTPSQ